jgi:hypothetical protein
MNWKGCERKWSWPNLRHYTGIYLEGLRKTIKNCQVNWCPDQDSNWAPHEHKSEVLHTGPTCLVFESQELF